MNLRTPRGFKKIKLSEQCVLVVVKQKYWWCLNYVLQQLPNFYALLARKTCVRTCKNNRNAEGPGSLITRTYLHVIIFEVRTGHWTVPYF
jgi:hypothetical protein